MFGLEDIICCGRDYHEDEKHFSLVFNKTDLLINMGINRYCCWYPLDAGYCSPVPVAIRDNAPMAPVGNPIIPTVDTRCKWDVCTALPATFFVLDDWATTLNARHVTGVVHGNLTPESVGVVHGRGVLINRGCCRLSCKWTRETPDDDVYGARWAATELFRLDNGNPHPTTMSDVYSFACLMLQMLTGRVPYCGTKRPEQVVYLKYLGREPIDTQTPKVADRYVAFMRWCWSPEPEKRPTMETIVGFIREEIKRLGE